MIRSKIRVAFLGPNPNFVSAFLTTENAFSRSGQNVGNHAFWNAVDSHFMNEREYINTWAFDPAYLRDNFDLFVIPASNFIHPERDLGVLSNRIEKTKLPVLVIGIGAQAANTASDIELKDGTKRFISMLSEQAVHITCRGDYSATVLSSHGAKNISALGCPSNLTNLTPELGHNLEKSFVALEHGTTRLKIIVNIDSHRRKFYSDYRKLIRLLSENYYSVVCQNPLELLQAARDGLIDNSSSHIEFQKKLWDGQYDGAGFDLFVYEKFVTFFNANHWMEYSRRFDVSIGTRLHGNMLALQSGVPSIFLSHDSRTRELIDIMKLPNCNLRDLNFTSIDEVLDKLNFDGVAYDLNRKVIAKRYVNILVDADLSVSKELENFVG